MIHEIQQAPLRHLNSFGIEARAARLVTFETADDLRAVFEAGGFKRWYTLGGGNNILFTRDFDGVLLHPAARDIRIVGREGDSVLVHADAGAVWDDLVAWAVQHGLWGIENLSAIPGTVGAAPVQNIGAYGTEAKDTLEEVEIFAVESRTTVRLAAAHCNLGYRDSIFKHTLRGRAIVLGATFRLCRTARPRLDYGGLKAETERRGEVTLQSIREAVCAIRHSKLPDPAVLGSAGSFFKNPVVDEAVARRLCAEYPDMPHYPSAEGAGRVKLAAGWLIDRCGMKGYRRGRVGVHDRQALVLVNHGGATGQEVMALADEVAAAVRERFGVEITPEVVVL